MPLCFSHNNRRRAFSFTEVLFAVVILGIGFIMVAAIFPVAIQQSKLTMDETTGASLARGGANYLERAMTGNAPGNLGTNCTWLQEATGTLNSKVQQLSFLLPSTDTALYTTLRGSLILPEDPRYGLVSLYRRKGTAAADADPAAQVYLFSVQSTLTSIFKPEADAKTPVGAAVGSETNLMAHSVRVAVRKNVPELGGGDFLAIDASASGGTGPTVLQNFNAVGANGTGAAVEGGYVIIASDNLANADLGRMNGNIYKLGQRRTDLDRSSTPATDPFPAAQFSFTADVVFELDASNPFTQDAGTDGILRRYQTGQTSTDDVVGIGNSGGPLSLYLPTSSTNSTISATATTFTPTATSTADGFVVGRSFIDPATPANGYDGNSMVVGLYTTFVKIN